MAAIITRTFWAGILGLSLLGGGVQIGKACGHDQDAHETYRELKVAPNTKSIAEDMLMLPAAEELEAAQRYAQAEFVQRQRLYAFEDAYGNSVTLVPIIRKIADLCRKQGKRAQAHSLLERANKLLAQNRNPLVELQARKTPAGKLGVMCNDSDGPCLQEAGDVYHKQGDQATAMKYYELCVKPLDGQQNQDPKVLYAAEELASLYMNHGRYYDAERLFERLARRERVVSERYLASLRGMAEAQQKQNKLAAAEKTYKGGIADGEITELYVGSGLAQLKIALAQMYIDQKKLKDAHAVLNSNLRLSDRVPYDECRALRRKCTELRAQIQSRHK